MKLKRLLLAKRTLLLISVLLNLHGCSGKRAATEKPCIAVTTSWLECAVRDIAGEDVSIVRLLPPGDCPGHFDVSPGMIRELSRCPLLFRFDFQNGVDSKLSGMTSRGLRIVQVSKSGGLCVPDTYLSACREIAGVLPSTHPASGATFEAHLGVVESRLSGLSETVQKEIDHAHLRGRKVVSSTRQQVFCHWLGLEVVSTFPRASDITPSSLEKLIELARDSDPRLIIANLQEGRRAADSIAQRLDASVIVFSNFPSMETNQRRFDDLVLSNVHSLIQGATP